MPKTRIPQTPMVDKETGRPSQTWHRFFFDQTNFPKIAFDEKLPAPKNPTGFVILNVNNTDIYVPYWSRPYGSAL